MELWWLAHICIAVVLLAMVTMVFYKDYASLIRNNMQIKTRLYLLTLCVIRMVTLKENTRHLQQFYKAWGRMLYVQYIQMLHRNWWLSSWAKPPEHRIPAEWLFAVTNPYLPDDMMLSVSKMSSCGTATAISLPACSRECHVTNTMKSVPHQKKTCWISLNVQVLRCYGATITMVVVRNLQASTHR
uniref:Putative metal dependent hydrolase n=1 Tax=Klebsiella pneumoniae TaxID=573 RepID=A0A8D9IM06_KLEPN|nr:putative metal dependent hydrolase [Klebsiella pneumoniae]